MRLLLGLTLAFLLIAGLGPILWMLKSSITPTLETALADLPAKPRVHELSKRIGISNKELLTALAEAGAALITVPAQAAPHLHRQVNRIT